MIFLILTLALLWAGVTLMLASRPRRYRQDRHEHDLASQARSAIDEIYQRAREELRRNI